VLWRVFEQNSLIPAYLLPSLRHWFLWPGWNNNWLCPKLTEKGPWKDFSAIWLRLPQIP
jgi:hypothetical protein